MPCWGLDDQRKKVNTLKLRSPVHGSRRSHQSKYWNDAWFPASSVASVLAKGAPLTRPYQESLYEHTSAVLSLNHSKVWLETKRPRTKYDVFALLRLFLVETNFFGECSVKSQWESRTSISINSTSPFQVRSRDNPLECHYAARLLCLDHPRFQR